MSERNDIVDQAIAWHTASQHDDMDWDAFTRWLEADEANARAFDEIAMVDAALGDISPPAAADVPIAANDEPGVPVLGANRWKRWAGAAIAASLIAVVALPMLRDAPATIYRTQGESLTIALEDGSSVILAPASELTIEGDSQQQMALDGGAYFDIRHDPSRQLTIEAGALSISDIGTSFDIQVAGDAVRVAVSEGRVGIGSDQLSDRVELAAGRQLHFDPASGRSVASPVEAAAVGGWRSGQLSYASTPLPLVLADLGRYAGVQVEIPEELADRLFSGTLAINDGTSALRDLSQLMGLELEGSNGVYRLAEPAG